MKLISHRGNINGPNPELENRPDYLIDALNVGFQVEIDVWKIGNDLFLGHDEPTYKVDLEFLQNKPFWCHAKNLESFHYLLENNIVCFWHQNDDFTLTSNGYIWTYPNKEVTNKSIIVCLDQNLPNESIKNITYGICGDNVGAW